jgi:deazaflavin-dependent oxidoreductase (nitroreductase family)
MQSVKFDWARMKNIQKIHRVLYALGLGPLIGRLILLLTTTGRRTGKKRVTPLQYEEIDGWYYLGAARGLRADWVRNVQACPEVELRVGAKSFSGCAEVVNDPAQFADFMEVRLQRHPRMIGLILEKAHGLPRRPSRAQLEGLAENEAVVIVRPVKV